MPKPYSVKEYNHGSMPGSRFVIVDNDGAVVGSLDYDDEGEAQEALSQIEIDNLKIVIEALKSRQRTIYGYLERANRAWNPSISHFSAPDVIELARQVSENYITYEYDLYGRDQVGCAICRVQEDDVGQLDVTHETNCAVLIARDILTRIAPND